MYKNMYKLHFFLEVFVNVTDKSMHDFLNKIFYFLFFKRFIPKLWTK